MKVALAGVWHVHAKDYAGQAAEHGEVIGVYDEDPSRAAAFGKEYGLPVYASLEELLAGEAEGVIVCSATGRHADLMVRIADSGKGIFTEKVLALTEEECLRIRDAVERNRVRFVISMPQKCNAGPRTVKALIDEGRLGQINYIRFRNCHNGSLAHWLPAHFYNPEETGGGAMIDLGAHGMYLIHWLRGEPEGYRSAFTHVCRDERDAQLNPAGLEDNAVTVMTYSDGTIAINETGFVSVGSPMTLEVGGSGGYVRWSGGAVLLTSAESGNRPVEVPLVPAISSPLAHFMNRQVPAGCGMEDAIALTRMMQGAYAAV